MLLIIYISLIGIVLLFNYIRLLGVKNGYKIEEFDDFLWKINFFMCVVTIISISWLVVNFKKMFMMYQVKKAFIDTANVNRQIYSDTILVPIVKVKKKKNIYILEVEQLPNMVEDPIENIYFINSSLKGINRNYIVDSVMMSDDYTSVKYELVDINSYKRLVPEEKEELKTDNWYRIKLMEGLEWDLLTSPHALIAGKTGSGKTTLINSILMQFEMSGSQVKLIDIKKEFVSRGYKEEDCAIDVESALKILDLAVSEMKLRQDKITQQGISQNKTGLTGFDINLPPYIIVIDEVASLMAMMNGAEKAKFSEMLLELIMLGRSSVVNVILSTQQANSKVVSTDVRDNLGLRVLLGSSSTEARRMVFGDRANAVRGVVSNFQGYYEILGETETPKIIKVPDLRMIN